MEEDENYLEIEKTNEKGKKKERKKEKKKERKTLIN